MNPNKHLLNYFMNKTSKKRRLNNSKNKVETLPTELQENNISNEKNKEDKEEKEDEEENEEKEDEEEDEEEEDEDEDEEEEDEDEDEEEEEEEDNEEDYLDSDNEEFLEQEIKDNVKLTSNFKIIKQEILKNEPNAEDLLTIPMRTEDRARLSFYYENYKSHVPYSAEWIESRETYNELLKEYKEGYKYYQQYSKKDIQKFKLEEDKFKMFNPQLALKYKILNLETSHFNKEVIYKKYNELIHMETSDDEYGKTKNWLTWATDIPHDIVNVLKIDQPTKFICKAKELLDKELYGMENVKEQILLFLSSKIKSPSMINTNLALLGPPGTGKTSIARLISKILGWGFSQISFGGIEKADFLKGHEYTYVGSGPGEIVKSLKKLGCKNGVIFLDEMDKISENHDIKSALLHIIDPSQNKDFRDMFLSEITIDLSNIWWISSMNSLPSDTALADRWSVINVEGYDYNAKLNIVKDYILPKSLINANLQSNDISFNKDSLKYLIDNSGSSSDKGVRTLEKNIKEIVSKINFIITHQDENGKLPFKITFQLKTKINIPLEINHDIIKKLMNKSKELDKLIPFMYI